MTSIDAFLQMVKGKSSIVSTTTKQNPALYGLIFAGAQSHRYVPSSSYRN